MLIKRAKEKKLNYLLAFSIFLWGSILLIDILHQDTDNVRLNVAYISRLIVAIV